MADVAKRVQEVALNSRTARMKLAPRHKPYFRLMADGIHIGYRRSTVTGRAGTWLVRRYLTAGHYATELLGTADDTPDMPADGVDVLTFDQAQSAAREWAREQAAALRAKDQQVSIATVRTVVVDYIATRTARSAKAGRNAELRLSHHVLAAPLADKPLLNVTDQDLSDWRKGLTRGGRGKQKAKVAPLAPATLARLLNDFRAALAAGARKAKASADLSTAIKEGLRAPEKPDRARTKQVLSDADVRKVVEAAAAQDADFGALVLLLAATGLRMDQMGRVTVVDFQPDARRIMVPVSRKGRGEKQITHIAVPLADDVVALTRPLTAGRAGHEPLLLHWYHHQLPGDPTSGTLPRWERVDRRPWKDAGEMTRRWRATVAAAGLPAGLVPYCLRHSSIVRGLRAGLPVRLVAAVHDTSADMIERHYGAFIVDATEDLLRRAIVPMASAEVKGLKPAVA
jgi:integrase